MMTTLETIAPRSLRMALLLVAGIAVFMGGVAAADDDAGLESHTKVFDLGPLPLDQIYPSMEGPSKRARFDYRGMDWVTSFKTEIVDTDSGEILSDKYFCHSQMQLDNYIHLAVNATGISGVRFPDGFGMPVTQIVRSVPLEWRGISVLGMVLNNYDTEIDRDVNVRIIVDYMTFDGKEPPPGLRKLYQVSLPMTQDAVEDEEIHHHPTMDDTAQDGDIVEGMEQHWVVGPGKQITRKRFSRFIAADATVHFAAVHLHNYGRYMRITNVTTGEVLWQSDVVYAEDPSQVQIVKIPTYSSAEGFPVYRDHEYEIEAMYDNTSGEPVDAMAMMYLYYNPEGNRNILFPEPPPKIKPHH